MVGPCGIHQKAAEKCGFCEQCALDCPKEEMNDVN